MKGGRAPGSGGFTEQPGDEVGQQPVKARVLLSPESSHF